ncbi:MAG: PDZ domain-containing protein [Nitrospinota bacterium]|nr:PDZ domain-containing protein [Nitrospinota bacterium]
MKILHLKLICKIIVFLFLLPFLGCSAGAKQEQVFASPLPQKKYQDIVSQAPKTPFEQILESTKGKDIEYMTDRFGFPAKSFNHPNENRIFEYNFSNIKKDKKGEKLIAGMLDMALGNVPFFSTLSDMPSDTFQCAFWLEVNDENVIRKWRWEGKDCESIYQRIRQIPKSKIHGAWLGIEVQTLTPKLKKRLNINSRISGGVFVGNVMSNSPAQKSGIIRKDVITEINRKTIYRHQDLIDIIAKQRPGDKVLILVFRNGRSLYVSVVLGETQSPSP